MAGRSPGRWLLAAGLLLQGCTALVPDSTRPAPIGSATVSAQQVAAALAAATPAGTGTDATDAPAAPTTPTEEKIRRAYALSQPGATAEQLAKAESLLDGLAADLDDPAARAVVVLLQRYVSQGRSLTAERRYGAELRRKIDQIKALERDLQERRHRTDG